MIKPDVITTWPIHCDYPGFRWWIRQNRSMFDNVFVTMSHHGFPIDSTSFLIEETKQDNITVFPIVPRTGQDDWRHVAIHKALEHSTNNWVLFIEQDFLFHNPTFLETVLSQEQDVGVGFKEGDPSSRYHPAFLLIKRSVLDTTSLNFAAGNGFDHFGQITEDLIKADISLHELERDFSFVQPRDWEHLAGFSQNYHLILVGQIPNFKLERFVEYNKYLLTLPVNHWSKFLPMINKAVSLGETT